MPFRSIGDVVTADLGGRPQEALLAPHIEEASASIKVKPFYHIVEEDLWVAGAVALVIPSGPREKGLAGRVI